MDLLNQIEQLLIFLNTLGDNTNAITSGSTIPSAFVNRAGNGILQSGLFPRGLNLSELITYIEALRLLGVFEVTSFYVWDNLEPYLEHGMDASNFRDFDWNSLQDLDVSAREGNQLNILDNTPRRHFLELLTNAIRQGRAVTLLWPTNSFTSIDFENCLTQLLESSPDWAGVTQGASALPNIVVVEPLGDGLDPITINSLFNQFPDLQSHYSGVTYYFMELASRTDVYSSIIANGSNYGVIDSLINQVPLRLDIEYLNYIGDATLTGAFQPWLDGNEDIARPTDINWRINYCLIDLPELTPLGFGEKSLYKGIDFLSLGLSKPSDVFTRSHCFDFSDLDYDSLVSLLNAECDLNILVDVARELLGVTNELDNSNSPQQDPDSSYWLAIGLAAISIIVNQQDICVDMEMVINTVNHLIKLVTLG